MRSNQSTTSPRRALHERSHSHTNSASPPASLHHVRSKSTHNSDEHENDYPLHDYSSYPHEAIYTSSPFPTKPEHVLLPNPGKGQQLFPPQTATTPSRVSSILSGEPSTGLAESSTLEASGSDSWVDFVHNSQSWLHDQSSHSSFPTPSQGNEDDDDDQTFKFYDDDKKTVSSGGDDVSLPPARTVKTVASLPSSRHPSDSSSPNIVPIGPPSIAPSSPNFVTYTDTSSVNFMRLGTSSNSESVTHRSNSVSSSANSLGTVIRHIGATPWIHGSPSEQSSWAARSFHSTPPYQSVHGSAQSQTSSHERDRSRSVRSHSHSQASSSQSGPDSEIQAVVDSGAHVQYPTIRAPSSSSSWVESSHQEPRTASYDSSTLHEPIPERSESRITSHLSTVPSNWSAECDNSFTGGANEPSSGRSTADPARPSSAVVRQSQHDTSLRLVNDSDENVGNATNLQIRNAGSGHVSTPSADSRRTGSMRSRATTSSFLTNLLPNWAKVYYRDGNAVNSALSLVTTSQSSQGHRAHPSNASRPMTRHGIRAVESTPRLASEDPRDPRSHWVAPPPTSRPPTGMFYQLRHSWSPHLYADRQRLETQASNWVAPSLDSRMEPILGRRNIQVWAFCFGFIFPLAWIVAAFLPLPPKPDIDLESTPASEVTLQARLYDLERRRHDNARWWRNLNRWMVPVGIIIITIIVALAAVGTTVGF
ncbi:putative serine-rich protein [Aspergillus chevalieri]|uniref:Serine-rich protein n=1 Tax=Aspergillus chevalieri TaxID=182096 RepID=A0A7R7ZNM2_ASPCH|nr:uncharacterized protein ACHE_50228A [Aspergillus chevalieri]BCR89030.1 hypothetical protein ACHE_50228A [Aspergillus chevalieri]